MTGTLLFALCTPGDFEWTDVLTKRLIANEYEVYLEAPHEQNVLQTSTALQQARLMLVVVSQESVLGDSADVFEDWWRPFAKQDRSIITIVRDGEPAGVEHWMPFDLRSFPMVNFDHEDAYTILQELIDDVLSPNRVQLPDPLPALPAPAAPAPMQPSKPTSAAKPIHKTPGLPPIPTARASHAIEQATNRRRARQWRRTLFLSPIIFALLVALWIFGLELAETYGSTAALLMVSGAVAIGSVFTVTVMLFRARRSGRSSPSKADINAGARSRRRRPDVYVEVISSVNAGDLGKTFPIDRPRLSIGKDSQDDIRIRDRRIDREHCIIFYNHNDHCYYLENLSNKATVVHDWALNRGDVRLIESGDLIVLGDSAVLQFRTNL